MAKEWEPYRGTPRQSPHDPLLFSATEKRRSEDSKYMSPRPWAEPGPEQQRLKQRLFGDYNRRLLNFSITHGDSPATPEEICGEVNKAMDEVERRRAAGDTGDGPARSRKPPTDLRQIFANGDNTHRFHK